MMPGSSLTLFPDETTTPIPKRIGRGRVHVLERARVLSVGTGQMNDFDYTLDPYTGCQFGCTYSYATCFVASAERRATWGGWVGVKSSAVEQIRRQRDLRGKSVYMSSVTDPYQPIEAKIGLTGRILEAMVPSDRQPRLVIQTRSPLVTRDIDLIRRFERVRVNVTIATDSEAVRKRFEPACLSNERRLQTLAELKAAGIRTCVYIAPSLPLENPERFARTLAAVGADAYVVQPFKPIRGAFAAGTRPVALEIAGEYGWTPADYRRARACLAQHLSPLYEGRAGHAPE